MSFRTSLPALVVLALSLSAAGQGTPAKPACSTDPKSTNPCPSTQAAPAQQFPYPGDPAPTPAAPPDSPAAAPTPSPNKQFPYPGETPAPSAAPSKQFPYPGDAKPGDARPDDSSSSSSSSSSSNPNDPDDPLDPSSNTPTPSTGNTVRRKLPKPTHLQSDDEREAEDVKVAEFYSDSGNDLGAYNRLKDAVKLIHDDADAFYLLGTVAARLHKQPESLDAFNRFLALEPDTRRAKSLRHTLETTQAKK